LQAVSAQHLNKSNPLSADKRGSNVASCKPFRRSIWKDRKKSFGTEGARIIISKILNNRGYSAFSVFTGRLDLKTR
jgi:hypothetical protein